MEEKEIVYLSKKMSPDKSFWERLGFVFYETDDDVLYEANLPEGWSIKNNGHPIFSKMYDDNGLERARMYYKPDKGSRSAYMDLLSYYNVRHKNDDEGNEIVYFGSEEEILYAAGKIDKANKIEDFYNNIEKRNNLINLASRFGDQNCPGWRNPLAYWNLSTKNQKKK